MTGFVPAAVRTAAGDRLGGLMQPNTALVLVSCTLCRQLHEPRLVDASNPFCQPCASVAARRQPRPRGVRPRGR